MGQTFSGISSCGRMDGSGCLKTASIFDLVLPSHKRRKHLLNQDFQVESIARYVLRIMEWHGVILKRCNSRAKCKDDAHNDFRRVYPGRCPTMAHTCSWTTILCSSVWVSLFLAWRNPFQRAWLATACYSFGPSSDIVAHPMKPSWETHLHCRSHRRRCNTPSSP